MKKFYSELKSADKFTEKQWKDKKIKNIIKRN